MPSDSQRSLAAAICDFLDRADVSKDDKESIDVARQCISDVFATDGATKPKATLEQIFGVYERASGGSASAAPAVASSNDAAPAAAAASSTQAAKPAGGAAASVDADTLAKAEAFKVKGNKAMSAKNYEEAISHYSEALDLIPDGKIFLSNRAAAYSSNGQHDLAIADAQLAAEIDPSYGKAWSRLGHAQFASGDLEAAKKSYAKGVEVDPQSEVMQRGLETVTRKLQQRGESNAGERSPAATGGAPGAGAGQGMPDFASLASMFGGAGGGGGGGAPDLAGILNNPQFMNMANNLMQSGALDSFMRNPQMAQMAQNFMNGGGLPDMNDPEVRRLAEQMRNGELGGPPSGSQDP
ncbi:Small glutamine-rich tetratricopeptide repeat-containing protein 2 [Savitreella phatthalungensis]